MKITLDRRNCTCWQPACESHFGAYIVQRSAFLSVLDELGVPIDDPAFHE